MSNVAQNTTRRPNTNKRDLPGVDPETISQWASDMAALFADDVWPQVSEATFAFASIDGATACGDWSEGPEEDRASFNIAIARLTSALRFAQKRIAEISELAKAAGAAEAVPDLDAAAEE